MIPGTQICLNFTNKKRKSQYVVSNLGMRNQIQPHHLKSQEVLSKKFFFSFKKFLKEVLTMISGTLQKLPGPSPSLDFPHTLLLSTFTMSHHFTRECGLRIYIKLQMSVLQSLNVSSMKVPVLATSIHAQYAFNLRH